MSDVAIQIFFIFLLFLFNGLLAMSEIAIITSRRARLEQLKEEGDKRAELAIELSQKSDEFLSTIQIGITLVGIFAGVFGGATLTSRLESFLNTTFFAPYSSVLSFVIIVGGITFFSLLIGELAPKRIALNNPEKIALRMARPLKMLSHITYPFVKILSISSNILLKLVGSSPSSQPLVSEEEVKYLIKEGTEAGVFEEAEQDMMESVLKLGNKPIGALMTPRTEIEWHDVEDSLEKFHETITQSSRSVFPIGKGSLDNVLGVIHTKDYLSRKLLNDTFPLEEIIKDCLFILESTPVLKVVEMFKRSAIHIAFIIDEHGVVQGLVTINDVLESIIGDISLTGEPESVQREDGSWLIDGMLPLDEFKKIFNIEKWPGEEKGHYHTMGGLILVHFGRIPSVGNNFEWNDFRFEVVDMDGRRVDKILVTKKI